MNSTLAPPILDCMVKSLLSYALVAMIGLVVAVVGVGAHRASPYIGIILALVMVGAAAIFARAWKSWAGLGLFAGSWLVLTTVFAGEGPGGSALIADDRLGLMWAIGGGVLIVLAAAVPRRLLVGPYVEG